MDLNSATDVGAALTRVGEQLAFEGERQNASPQFHEILRQVLAHARRQLRQRT